MLCPAFFSVLIQSGYYPQVNADLYVSPEGNNENDGLTPETPLRTVYYAMSKIVVDSVNVRAINLLPGTYSEVEPFPIYASSYVSLIGEDQETTIVEAPDNELAILYHSVQGCTLMDLSVHNCGGLRLSHHLFILVMSQYQIITNLVRGGGILCENSNLIIESSNITNNSTTGGGHYASRGGGLYFLIARLRCTIFCLKAMKVLSVQQFVCMEKRVIT